MQPGVLVASIRAAAGMGVLQQFTSNKRWLYAAIEHLRQARSAARGYMQ
ncbi:MAG TPA: hypothetical protein VF747_08145 [Blastocatellia bacterium]|jgi:hypothetical protein